jgi:hypothetical protein
MPLLTFVDGDGTRQRLTLADNADICIGTDGTWSHVQLPAALGVAPRHAVIARSTLNRLLMLVDLTGDQTWVNQHPVVKVRVLRQGDTLRLGRCELNIWEVTIRHLYPDDPAVGQKCPVSRRVLQVGDAVIACPGCGMVHERDAWFLIERCAAGCGYPNRAIILDTLPAGVMVERNLDAESRLVERIEKGKVLQDGDFCQAGQARDQVPFQQGQNAVYCPSCQSPFHLECFLTLSACPVCQYDIAGLIDQTFLADEGIHV